jgi:hypothetical protein
MKDNILPRPPGKLWQKFEREYLAAEVPNYYQNLKYFEALYREAQLLGIIPGPDPLAGLEVDIRIAAVVAKPHVHRPS